MSAKVLTKAAAKEAKIDIIEDGRGSQAVHDVVVAMRAARRSGSANTKTKAEVDMSGARPWRQKGTGRARAGYVSSPIWRGDGDGREHRAITRVSENFGDVKGARKVSGENPSAYAGGYGAIK